MHRFIWNVPAAVADVDVQLSQTRWTRFIPPSAQVIRIEDGCCCSPPFVAADPSHAATTPVSPVATPDVAAGAVAVVAGVPAVTGTVNAPGVATGHVEWLDVADSVMAGLVDAVAVSCDPADA